MPATIIRNPNSRTRPSAGAAYGFLKRNTAHRATALNAARHPTMRPARARRERPLRAGERTRQLHKRVAADLDVPQPDIFFGAVKPGSSWPEEHRRNARRAEDRGVGPERHAHGPW